MDRRVVVTGLGALCPLGIGHERIWPELAAGRSGIAAISTMDVGDFPCKLGGEITGFVAKEHIAQRKSIKVMARDIQLAVAAAHMAAVDAGIEPGTDPTRTGCAMGAGLIPSNVDEQGPATSQSLDDQRMIDLKQWGKRVMAELYPLWLLKYLPNMLACHISIFQDAQGPNNTLLTGDAAGLQALGEGYYIIQRDSADVFIAGGGDSRMNPLSMLRFEMLGQLTHRNEEGPLAVKPFDANRAGFVPAEGAGVLILEELAHAERRGARIYAEIAGFGCAHQTVEPTKLDPSPRGMALAMRAALDDARITPEDVSFVCAHAVGSVREDVAEARAIREVFGDRELPVTAPRSLIGQTCTAAGALDALFCSQALVHDVVFPTPTYSIPDPECPVDVVTQPRENDGLRYALINAISLAGQCASLVLEKWQG